MTIIIWTLLFLLTSGLLVCRQFSMQRVLLGQLFLIGIGVWLGLPISAGLFLATLVCIPLVLLASPSMRLKSISRPLYRRLQKIVRPLSPTEKSALDAGSCGWEASLFQGQPSWQELLTKSPISFTQEEKEFIAGPVQKVCAMTNDWQVTQIDNKLPDEVWSYMKSEGFFGLRIGKEYGGKGFSMDAVVRIITTLASRSGALAVTVVVPNSIGPSKLIQRYGSQVQKDNYLPQFANGQEIPCMALTNPWAGSDAANIPDTGVICRRVHDGKEQLGILINFSKRYITLAPIATIIGIAFQTLDPDQILGDECQLGITCALLPVESPGISIGRRHQPLAGGFPNGPIHGMDVFIPLDQVIGGAEQIGNGWSMLMEQLITARGTFLPACCLAMSKVACSTTTSYALIREQFQQPIGRFGAVSELLTEIAGYTYMMESCSGLFLKGVRQEKPSAILSSVLKFQSTEGARIVINNAMDILAGKGICIGPANPLASLYSHMPIGITVEGSNTLLKSMVIFGQGLVRSHPLLHLEIEAILRNDAQGEKTFNILIGSHLDQFLRNMGQSFFYSFSSRLIPIALASDTDPRCKRLCQSLSRQSLIFAFLTDLVVFIYGPGIKRNEQLSSRFALALSWMINASLAISYFNQGKGEDSEFALLQWVANLAHMKIQSALLGIITNLPNRFLRLFARSIAYPFGGCSLPTQDRRVRAIAKNLMQSGPLRYKLLAGIYPGTPDDSIKLMEKAFLLALQVEPIKKRLRQQDLLPELGEDYASFIKRMLQDKQVNQAEANSLLNFYNLSSKVIAVDEFLPDHFLRSTAA